MRIVFSVICCLLCASFSYPETNNPEKEGGNKYFFNPEHIAFKNDSGFEKMPKPNEGDWLDRFKENGQTFEQYLKQNPNRPNNKRYVIYLQPLGEFNEEQNNLLRKAKEFTAIFFQMDVVVTATRSMPVNCSRDRSGPNGKWRQYQAGAIMDKTLKPSLPKDAFCYLGITMGDLYPDESWNFVFGQASLGERVGVYSLARYFPSFYGEKETPGSGILALRRSCKVLSHEACHMFGLLHCIFYQCDESGSNSLEETDRYPLHLCPICLKKLAWNIGFDIIKREKELLKFYQDNKLSEEFKWAEKRLVTISKEPYGK